MAPERKWLGELKKSNRIILFILFFLFTTGTSAQVSVVEAFPNLNFTTPVDIQHAGDNSNRLFVVEQEGLIHVFRNTPEESEMKVFLDIRDRVKQQGEMGLLGLAFHPEYENNGYFFVNYTTDDPIRRSIIARFQVTSNPDSADPDSELRFLRQDQPDANHNGGQLAFGPDSLLYIAFGDGGGAGDPNNNAQRLNTILGKIIRINVDTPQGEYHFSIPPGNPFRGNPHGYREEIYAYGFRNPWRFSIDSISGTIWCGDVGQGEWEEINLVERGGNYGWRFKEGKNCYNPSQNCDTISNLIEPIWAYEHTSASGSVTGGYVYRGITVPELYGKYIYADFMQNKIWSLEYDFINPAVNELISDAPGAITSFGVDQNQELYFCAFTSGGNKLFKFSSLTDVQDNNEIGRTDYRLYPAFPNPFNPSTFIKFHIPEESYTKIEVFNTTGELISVLYEGKFNPGYHQVEWDAENTASGMYFISMQAVSASNERTYTNNIKVVLVK